MRALQRPGDHALADFRNQRARGRELPVFARDVVGRRAAPQREHGVDALEEHRVAIGVEIAENLGVGQQAAGADPEIEPAVEQMVEHRDLHRDMGGMAIGQVHGAGAEPHRPDPPGEGGEEHDAGGDVLGEVGDMLADIAFAEAQLVGEQEGLLVLAQGLAPVAAERMDRHREETELHGGPASR